MFIQFHHAPWRRGLLHPRQKQGPSWMTHDTLNLRRVGNVVGYRHPGYLAFQSIFNQMLLLSFRKLKDPKTVYHVAPLDVLVEPKGSSCYIAAMAESIYFNDCAPDNHKMQTCWHSLPSCINNVSSIHLVRIIYGFAQVYCMINQ